MVRNDKEKWETQKWLPVMWQKKNSFITGGIMNLQHSQWNHLLGFDGPSRNVAKSDANVIIKYKGYKRSNRLRLRYPSFTADS